MITNFNIFGQLIKIESRRSLYKKKCLGMWLSNENKILVQENTDKYPLNDDIINQSHHTLGKVIRVGDIISETTIKGFSEAFFNDDYQKVYKYLNEIIKQKG